MKKKAGEWSLGMRLEIIVNRALCEAKAQSLPSAQHFVPVAIRPFVCSHVLQLLHMDVQHTQETE